MKLTKTDKHKINYIVNKLSEQNEVNSFLIQLLIKVLKEDK
ncbi:hypothetical protein [Enterococcus sp. HY326]|nr:hypothetical protein [Enterococcus sp. HY326]